MTLPASSAAESDSPRSPDSFGAALRACIAELAIREPRADGLNAGPEPSSEDGPAAAGDEGEDLRVGTYHSHA